MLLSIYPSSPFLSLIPFLSPSSSFYSVAAHTALEAIFQSTKIIGMHPPVPHRSLFLEPSNNIMKQDQWPSSQGWNRDVRPLLKSL